jgi:hypothetical protein
MTAILNVLVITPSGKKLWQRAMSAEQSNHY